MTLETLLMADRRDDAEPVLVQTDLKADRVVLVLDDETTLEFDRLELLSAVGGVDPAQQTWQAA